MYKNEKFWQNLEELMKNTEIIFDRPKGIVHPKRPEIVYPLDYGYLKGVDSSDGDDLDIWVGSEDNKKIKGIICTADLFKKDVEIKIIYGCTEDEINTIFKFINAYDNMQGIIIKR